MSFHFQKKTLMKIFHVISLGMFACESKKQDSVGVGVSSRAAGRGRPITRVCHRSDADIKCKSYSTPLTLSPRFLITQFILWHRQWIFGESSDGCTLLGKEEGKEGEGR